MKIKISIEKKYAYIIFSLIILLGLSLIVIAVSRQPYTQDEPSPGHYADEVYLDPPIGNQLISLQSAIETDYDNGGIKPFSGYHEFSTFTLSVTIDGNDNTPDNSQSLGVWDVCFITLIEADPNDAFICRVYAKDPSTNNLVVTVNEKDPFDYSLTFPKKRLNWYGHRSTKAVQCEVGCIKWN